MVNLVRYLDYCPEGRHVRYGGWAWLTRRDIEEAPNDVIFDELQLLLTAFEGGNMRNVILTNMVNLWSAVSERGLIREFARSFPPHRRESINRQIERMDRLYDRVRRISPRHVSQSDSPSNPQNFTAMKLPKDSPVCGR